MATKERRKTPPGAPKYHRLTDEKRIIIEALRKEGCSNGTCATPHSRRPLFEIACPWGRAPPRRFAAPLRGRLRPPPRAVSPKGGISS